MLNYGDAVMVNDDAPAGLRRGQRALIVGITIQSEKTGSHFDQFPEGTVYLIEFDDGEGLDIHEGMLTPIT